MRTEPLILSIRFLVFDREPYRTKTGTDIRLLLIAYRTAPHQFWCGTDRGLAPKLVRSIDKRFKFVLVRIENRTAPMFTFALNING